MKKLVLMALTSLMILATSCKKDEEKSVEKNETQSIEGTWYKESSITNGEVETLDECRKRTNVTFSAGNFKTLNYETLSGECKMNEANGTYTISGSTITTNGSTFTFSIKENILTMSGKNNQGITIVQTWKKR